MAALRAAEAAGMEVDVSCFNVLLKQLQFEVRPVEPLLAEMRARGIDADKHTQAVLDRPADELSKMRTSELKRLLGSGQQEAARQLFDRLLKMGASDSHHVGMMMRQYCSTSDEQTELARAASAHLDLRCYTSMLTQLQLEGRSFDDLLDQMRVQGLQPDVRFERAVSRSPDELMRIRTTELVRLCERGEHGAASELFSRLLNHQKVDGQLCCVMMAHGGGTSEDGRALMERAEAAGVEVGVRCFKVLLNQLQFEGRPVEPLLAEMRARGIEADERTQAVLDRSADELSKMRTSELKRLLVGGEQEAARQLYGRLLEAGAAYSHHTSVMMAHGGGTSEDKRALMERAEAAGVQVGVRCFNVLLNQLQFEGRPVEPVLAEMHARGIDADKHTQAVLDRPADELSKMRTSELKKLLVGGEQEAARQLFDRLLAAGAADWHHTSVMMAHGGGTSEDRRAHIKRSSSKRQPRRGRGVRR